MIRSSELRMKKIILTLSILVFASINLVHADEGMWLLSLLKKYNYEAMRAELVGVMGRRFVRRTTGRCRGIGGPGPSLQIFYVGARCG